MQSKGMQSVPLPLPPAQSASADDRPSPPMLQQQQDVRFNSTAAKAGFQKTQKAAGQAVTPDVHTPEVVYKLVEGMIRTHQSNLLEDLRQQLTGLAATNGDAVTLTNRLLGVGNRSGSSLAGSRDGHRFVVAEHNGKSREEELSARQITPGRMGRQVTPKGPELMVTGGGHAAGGSQDTLRRRQMTNEQSEAMPPMIAIKSGHTAESQEGQRIILKPIDPKLQKLQKVQKEKPLDFVRGTSVERANETRKSFQSCVVRLVQSPGFDSISAALVLFNSITIGVQTDHNAKELLAKSTTEFRLIEDVFCIVFAAELFLRMIAFGTHFFCVADWKWNMLDLCLVSLQVFDQTLSHFAAGDDWSLNFSFMRVLRILRLVRILRMVRVLRLIAELRTIVTSILGSLKSLMWTVALLFMLVYVFAVFLTQQVLDYRVSHYLKGDERTAQDEKLKYLFGNLGRSILTLYQAISGGIDWDQIAEPLMSRISVILGVVIAVYTALAVLALMNVVTGVFVESAMESAKCDRMSYMLQHVKQLFAEADPENTGSIDWDRFHSSLDKKFMKEFFAAIDIDISDAQSVFALLDTDDNGEIDLDEFLNGCLGLHGPAQAIHLATLLYESRMSQRYQSTYMTHLINLLHSLLENMVHDSPEVRTSVQSLVQTSGSTLQELDSSMSGRRSFAQNKLKTHAEADDESSSDPPSGIH